MPLSTDSKTAPYPQIKIYAPLNTPNQATFYTGGAHGYIDYPTAETMAAVA